MFFRRPQPLPGLLGPSPFPAPGLPFAEPATAPMQDVASPAEPFLWGEGGARITPEEIARRRLLDAARGRSDYSPVASVWQGLGRVVDGLTSGIEERKLDKAAKANTEHSAAITQALLGGHGDAAAAAMVDPTLSNDVQGFARMIWERDHPKPVSNDTAADMTLMEQQLGPGAGKRFLEGKIDPIVTIPTPFGPYVGRQSGLEAALARFQTGAAPATSAPPATLPPDFNFDQGGPGGHPSGAGFPR